MNKKIAPILINLLILAIIGLICAAPFLLTSVAGTIASQAGCQLDEGSIHPCIINGQDYGETLYSMGMSFWFTFISIPTAIVLLVIYLVVLAVIWIARRRGRSAKDNRGK